MATITETGDASANGATAYSMGLADTFAGTIDRSGDIDWVRVTLESDYGYYFTLSGDGSATPLGSKDLRIWTEGGAQVDRHISSGIAGVQANTTTGGTYFIDVRGSSSSQEGGYTLTMHRETVNTAGTRQVLDIGGETLGAIDYGGDSDWIKVDLEAGYGYYFRVEGDGSNQAIGARDLRLLTAGGAQVDRDTGSGASDVFVTTNTSAAGTWFLDMRGGSSGVTGGYRITAVQEEAGSAATRETLAMGGTEEGRIDYSNDRDWFKASFEANQTLLISTEGFGTTPLGSHTIVLRDASGAVVGQAYAVAGTNQLIVTIPKTGEYYIDIGGTGAGDYRVSLEDGIRTGTWRDETLSGSSRNDHILGMGGNDLIAGGTGHDTLDGGDGADTLNGGTGDDFLFGGPGASDLRDVIYGGDGNDWADGGWGNDELNGGVGNDTLNGDFGADTLIGNDGNDLLSGAAGADVMFGNAGNDTLNGGFGYDRLNGGAGADKFFHQGVADHGSDWVQDYSAAQGDVLQFGIAGATKANFQVNYATTPGAGAAGVTEAFVIYKPTGQILWALIDGGAQTHINVQSGASTFDLLT